MPELFISYTHDDAPLAQFVHDHLRAEHVNSFMASVSLSPGERWSPSVLQNLRDSEWVLVLVSQAACRSSFVQQEIGAAIAGRKKVIPVVWDIDPSQLPGWLSEHHVLDLRAKSFEAIQIEAKKIAGRVKAGRASGFLVLVGGLLALKLLSK